MEVAAEPRSAAHDRALLAGVAAVPLLTWIVLLVLEPYPGVFASCDFEPSRDAAVDAWHAHWRVVGPASAVLLLAGLWRLLPATPGRRWFFGVAAVLVLVPVLPAAGVDLDHPPFEWLGVAGFVVALPWLLLGALLTPWGALAAGAVAMGLLVGAGMPAWRWAQATIVVSGWLAVAYASVLISHTAFAC